MSYQDPSNQAVNIFTRLADFALKIIGAVTKHLAAAFYAVYRDHKNGDNLKSGKVKAKKLLKSSSECRMFTISDKELMSKFKKFAKQYHIPYSAKKHKVNGKKIFNITIRGEDISRVKYLLGENLDFMKVADQTKGAIDKLKGGVVNLDKLVASNKDCRMFTIEGDKAMKDFKAQAKEYGVPFALEKHTDNGKTFYNTSIRAQDVAVAKYVLGEKLNFTKPSEQGEITQKSNQENPLKTNLEEPASKDTKEIKTSETIGKLKDYKEQIDKGEIAADKVLDKDIGNNIDVELPSRD